MQIKKLLIPVALGLALQAAGAAQDAPQPDAMPPAQATAPKLLPAVKSPLAARATMLGAARAGDRIVAVGDHGVVLLSDDNGRSFRQAGSVPTRSVLTSVSFADAKHGWAVGHWGVVLHTTDGGETWTLQRDDPSVDQPLFSVAFTDREHGIAVGLWSLMLETDDGGTHWRKRELPPPPGSAKADRNLFSIFAGPDGHLYVAGEQGIVLRSTDRGAHWEYRQTGYRGSFWTGAAGADGAIYVGGMRGTVYRSGDGGETWAPAASGVGSSMTTLVALKDSMVGAGLEGALVRAANGSAAFTGTPRPDRVDLTAAVVAADGTVVAFSTQGPLRP